MNPPASPAEWNIDMESEIRPKVSEEAYRLREETILEGDGPFPPELIERLTQLLEARDFNEAFIALDQWRFSRLSPEEQRREQRWHRRIKSNTCYWP